jgi:hypothetical protein
VSCIALLALLQVPAKPRPSPSDVTMATIKVTGGADALALAMRRRVSAGLKRIVIDRLMAADGISMHTVLCDRTSHCICTNRLPAV